MALITQSDSASLISPSRGVFAAATLAELKTFTVPLVNQTVEVDGSVSRGDGLAGTYYWNATDSRADNGTTIIQSNAGGVGRWNLVAATALDSTFTPAGAGAVAESVQKTLRRVIYPQQYGAVGDGASHPLSSVYSSLGAAQVVYSFATSLTQELDWAGITAAFRYAQAQAFAGIAPSSVPIITATVDLGAGDFLFNGPALNYSTNSAIFFRGAGRQQTRIQITNSDYFVNTDKLIYSADVRGIHFTGGKGAFRYSGTATNVQGTHVVEDCYFGNYTECAIGNDATDMPYWKIHRNIFLGTITSKGVCLSGLSNSSTIEHNAFEYNLIHIEIGSDGTGAVIHDNNFIRNFANVGTAMTDIWLVPGGATTGLAGVQITNNELDGDNLDVNDYRILIADEDTATGTDHITYKPKLSNSTNWAGPLKVKDNRVAGIGASSRALITSWTKFIKGLECRNDKFGTIVQDLVFGAGVNVPGGTQSSLLNTFEASHISPGAADYLLAEPVVPYSGVFDDPNALYQGYSSVHSYHPSGYDPSFLDLTTTDVSAFSLSTGTGAAVADATGASFAFEFTATGAGGEFHGTFTPVTVNRLAYIEFDLKQGSSLPLPTLDFRITNNVNLGDVAVRRFISIPAYWKRIRIPFSLPSAAATYNLVSFQVVGYSAGVATKFQVARLRIYHAHEPVSLVTLGGTLNTNAPVTVTAATYTVLFTDAHIIANRAGTVTLTFPSALLNLGREITIRTIQAQTVVSASGNVVPLVGGAAGTAILAATAGKWALAKSDGTNWQLMSGN